MIPPPVSGPSLPAIVHRQRLHRLIDRVATPGIVVVSAQAAQGKTTLIADYLESRGLRSAWMTLGPDDADPVYFSRHLTDVFRPFSESVDTRPGEKALRPRITAVIAELLKRLPPDLNLVFDGWERIGSPELAVRWSNAIVAARPSRGCIYFLSREDLPIALQRNRMRRKALVLTDQDLAFTEDEIGDFFDIVNGIALGAEDRQKVEGLTAGWAGGLVILAEELQRYPESTAEMLSAPTVWDRLQTDSGGYFQEEIYRRQPEAMRVFLVGAALLDRVPAELLQAQLGPCLADRSFAEAARQHLFIQILPVTPGPWAFRFNPLFRTFLKTRAREMLSDEKIRQILIQAARYHEARTELETAATYYLRAEDIPAAVRVITTIGIELSIDGRFDEIGRLTALLPPPVIREDPWLSMLKATVFRIRGGRRTIEELQSAHQAFLQAAHLRGQMLALAYLIETAVFSGYQPESLVQWVTQGERLLKAASRLAHFTYAKALLWQQVGLGVLHQKDGDLQKGLSACENAVILGKRIGAHRLVTNTLIIAAHAHVQAGEFEQSRERLAAARDLGDNNGFPEYKALQAMVEFHQAFIGAKMTAAAGWLKKAQRAIDTLGLIILYPACLEASGMLQIHCKQHAALEKTHRHLHDVAILLDNPGYRAIGFWLAGLNNYHQARYRRAEAAMRHALDSPGLPAVYRARNLTLMGFIALNAGRFEEAGSHFLKALTLFEEKGLVWYASEARLGMGLVQNACRDVAGAENSLETAFQTASLRQYEKFPTIRPADLARACVLSIQLKLPSAIDHARHLLANRLDDTEIRSMATTEAGGPFARSFDARETRQALYQARIPVLAIRTLGGLQILRNGTDPISARAWQGSRPALLFKAILVHGGRHIPKDILVEALWPDKHPDHSLQNFKVTLHRLRKLLEPDLIPSRGSAYIHLKDNLVSLDKHLCEVDTDALHRLCKRIRREDTPMDTQDLLDMRREAVALYQGDFLPEEPYLTWAEMKRTTLRQAFIQLMYRLGRRLQDQREFNAARRCYRRIVATDPGQEKAQRRLIHLLDEAGRSQEALQTYHAFHTFLDREIGATPDRATVKLFQSIRKRLGTG